MRKDQQKFISFDPGDVHVGVAVFDQGRCVQCMEQTPLGSLKMLLGLLKDKELDHVVIERYQLYPNKAMLQSGSDMLTSQLIGAMRALAWLYDVPVTLQQAALKKPTEALIRRRNIERLSFGKGDHAKDAETHGYTYLWKD